MGSMESRRVFSLFVLVGLEGRKVMEGELFRNMESRQVVIWEAAGYDVENMLEKELPPTCRIFYIDAGHRANVKENEEKRKLRREKVLKEKDYFGELTTKMFWGQSLLEISILPTTVSETRIFCEHLRELTYLDSVFEKLRPSKLRKRPSWENEDVNTIEMQLQNKMLKQRELLLQDLDGQQQKSRKGDDNDDNNDDTKADVNDIGNKTKQKICYTEDPKTFLALQKTSYYQERLEALFSYTAPSEEKQAIKGLIKKNWNPVFPVYQLEMEKVDFLQVNKQLYVPEFDPIARVLGQYLLEVATGEINIQLKDSQTLTKARKKK